MRLQTSKLVPAQRGSDRALFPERSLDARGVAAQANEEAEGLARPLTPEFVGELRNLLTTLAKGHAVQRTPHRIAVSGAQAEADAPFITASLAITCAGSGYRVLLVDAGLDRPRLHDSFALSPSPGVTELLSSLEPPHLFVQPTSVPNLSLIGAGAPVANYSSLLSRERLFHRIEPLANRFEYIIVACGSLPPSLVGRVAGGADSVILAVKENVSSLRDLSSVVEVLDREGIANPAVLMVS
ncbi:hypothetical protein HMF7854_15110 [Sphingomonas ginkgonis]|uniref:Uncharacterized protein n=1 Tax=Sphingomonas ginkgonis TaxID=2315330 RepID=A0A3R9WS57_9SPHN|nr:CpsD/CapB family tyrosine-protein kinase [Sphingomonas ginkgonis]RST32021.1 hypothetical protein HMF7854_15110 [Sphingomonas ginkgonis]